MLTLNAINPKVSETLKTAADQIIQRVVDRKVEAALAGRANIVAAAIEAETALNKQLQKNSSPDLIFHTAGEGGAKVIAFTPQRQKLIEGIKEKLNKLNTYFMKAMETGDQNDFDQLERFTTEVSKSSNGGDDKPAA